MSSLFVVLTISICGGAAAQELIEKISFDAIPAGAAMFGESIHLEGNTVVSGEVQSAVGYRFPDGSFQSTAASGTGGRSSCQSLTANAGLYSNTIADFIPPEPFAEVCFKNGDVLFDIHAVAESPAGGACVPGDIGWIIDRLERTSGPLFWADAKAECLAGGMRLPEPFEWQFTCTNAAQIGVSEMTDNWEWSSNEARFFHPETSRGIGATVMGGGSCSRGSWTWLGRKTGGTDPASFRCVR